MEKQWRLKQFHREKQESNTYKNWQDAHSDDIRVDEEEETAYDLMCT